MLAKKAKREGNSDVYRNELFCKKIGRIITFSLNLNIIDLNIYCNGGVFINEIICAKMDRIKYVRDYSERKLSEHIPS